MYSPPFFLFNAHLETIYPALFRRVILKGRKRERITTPDDDFLDLDWYTQSSDKLVIIQHGLEGSSDRAYILGMAKAFFNDGYDVLAWNFRGCSGEVNKQLRFYHSGATDDLHTVISHAEKTNRYNAIFLIGFSLGGNVTLKYLGEDKVSPLIKRAVAFSVPIDLYSSCKKISMPSNRIYAQRFIRSLKAKIRQKAAVMPGQLNTSLLPTIKSLVDFDNAYTAPLHGFKDAVDYYTRCSAINFLTAIKVPTLLVNTKNDPFLSSECFPSNVEPANENVTLEFPLRGGHVGFMQLGANGLYWSEKRALEWLSKQ